MGTTLHSRARLCGLRRLLQRPHIHKKVQSRGRKLLHSLPRHRRNYLLPPLSRTNPAYLRTQKNLRYHHRLLWG